MKIIKSSNLTWIDIYKPQEEDIVYLKENFNFHPLILKELLTPTLRPKVESYDHYLYMVLHFPVYDQKLKFTKAREIDFLITKDVVITARYEEIKQFNSFAEKIEKENNHAYFSKTPAHLIYYIIKELYELSSEQLNDIEIKIDKSEDKIFKGKEREMLRGLSILKREVLDFRRIVKPQGITLESLSGKGVEFFSEELEPYFSDITGEYEKVCSRIEDYKETIEALDKTNNSLLAAKMNEIMKVLTIFATITFPLTLVANIFGMNTKTLPLVGKVYDFWIVMAIMAVATALMFMYFKRKNWI